MTTTKGIEFRVNRDGLTAWTTAEDILIAGFYPPATGGVWIANRDRSGGIRFEPFTITPSAWRKAVILAHGTN